ncbi:hypothetical protein [Catenulispora rubra]|uniref:hypothetical protein n=1 Tax=Catenulispora rubra TaxID=280293 RepID=UPI00189219D6|nr:hypothetical protein [Catenulispora rubra]
MSIPPATSGWVKTWPSTVVGEDLAERGVGDVGRAQARLILVPAGASAVDGHGDVVGLGRLWPG